MANRKGHAEIRPASGNQFKVLNVGPNGEMTKSSERLTSHANCITNIASEVDACNGTHILVRDYTTASETAEYGEYAVFPDGTTSNNRV